MLYALDKTVHAQDVPRGSTGCIEVPFPVRGFLSKVIVTQLTGTLAAFEVDIYSRAGCCSPTDDLGNSDALGEVILDRRLHKVGPTLVGVGGYAERWTDGPGYPFWATVDTEGPLKNRRRSLIVEIRPTGLSGDELIDFAVSLGGCEAI